MKAWIVGTVALLAGLLLGSWGPRSEVLRLRRELQDARADRRTGSGIDSVTGMLRIDAAAEDKPEDESGDGDVDATDQAEEQAQPIPERTGPRGGPFRRRNPREEDPASDRPKRERMLDNIEQAADLWELRSDIARGNVIANLGLRDEEVLDFDVVVDAMNLRLEHAMTQWAGELRDTKPVTTEHGLRMMNELTGILVLSYDELDRKLPRNWRRNTGNDFDLVDFVDPRVAMPLVDVADRLEDMERDEP